MRVRYQASTSAWSPSVRSSHRSTDISRVAGSCGSGMSSGSHPKAANSARRPVRTASARSGSGWSVMYANGLEAAHSSPWNSSGDAGPSSTTAAAA
jgi:hypothetical protein